MKKKITSLILILTLLSSTFMPTISLALEFASELGSFSEPILDLEAPLNSEAWLKAEGTRRYNNAGASYNITLDGIVYPILKIKEDTPSTPALLSEAMYCLRTGVGFGQPPATPRW